MLRNLLIATVTVTLFLPAFASAEVPPNLTFSVPADGAERVPLNARIWLYGETLDADWESFVITMTDVATDTAVTTHIALYPLRDYHYVDWSEDTAGTTGRSRRRHLIALIPSSLSPGHTYRVDYNLYGEDSGSFSFTTEDLIDTRAPGVVAGSAPVHSVGGMGDDGPRLFTLVNLAAQADESGLPLLLELAVGETAETSEPVGFVLWRDTLIGEGIVPGHVEGCIFVRAVDLAGNVGPWSECLQGAE